MTAARVRIGQGCIGLDEVFARMPFRFGVVTIEAAVAATLALELTVDGKRVTGYASEILAYKWFDKRPEKTEADNVADLLSILRDAVARAAYLPESDAFSLWRALDVEVREAAFAAGHNALMAGYGTSLVERAMLDGIGRARGSTLWRMLHDGTTGFDADAVFPELASVSLGDALPADPLSSVAIRHTVGMADPIDDGDLGPGGRLADGLPETLEDYLRDDGIRFLKIKVAGDRDADLDRLRRIAGLLDRLEIDAKLTLDGNEQFASLDTFAGFMEALRGDPALGLIRDGALFVEQPLDRREALSGPLDPAALNAVGLPLLIDESDDRPDAFRMAIDLGYRGVSHKNCKGIFRSFMNAMLARHHSGDRPGQYFQSAEDLSCLPVVGLNADLAVVAALGVGHVERNGHHYFDGTAHLSPDEVAQALADHPDLYQPAASVGARLVTGGGTLGLASLQRPGMGFPAPRIEDRIPPEDWSFDRLTKRDPKKEAANAPR